MDEENGPVDRAMDLAAWQFSDAQQLRRALSQLVETCRVHYHGSPTLEPALLFAEAALDDTTPAGQMRRMRERHSLVMAERFDECRRNGRHLVIRGSSGEVTRCGHCERPYNFDSPDGL